MSPAPTPAGTPPAAPTPAATPTPVARPGLGRPSVLVAVVATGTEVGKTWVIAATCTKLIALGHPVAARKPAQSFDPEDPSPTDAEVLAATTGTTPEAVCPPHRWYELPLAPPMAAAELGRPAFVLADLVAELSWPQGATVGFVEGAGGVRSPIADDADNTEFVAAVAADLVVLVADAGLGTINNVRLARGALEAPHGPPVIVLLNRYDPTNITHQRNRAWLTERDSATVFIAVDDIVTAITAITAAAIAATASTA